MRFALLLSLALIAAACGSSTASSPTEPRPTAGPQRPPAAWIETRAGGHWLGFSSFCWSHRKNFGVCADALAPKCSQQNVPKLSVEKGERVSVHLGYTPVEVSVEHAHTTLNGRTATWRIQQLGKFLLFTSGRRRDAGYVGCGALP
jgi:hypothetical protein